MDYDYFYYSEENSIDPPVYTELPDPPWSPDTVLQCLGHSLLVFFLNAFPGAASYHVRLVDGFDVKYDTVVDEPRTRSYFQVTPEKNYRVWIQPLDKNGSALKKSWMVSKSISCSVSEAAGSTEPTSPLVTSTAGHDVKVENHPTTLIVVLIVVVLLCLVILGIVFYCRWRRRKRRPSRTLHRQSPYQPRPDVVIPNGSPSLLENPSSPTAGDGVSEKPDMELHLLGGPGGSAVQECQGEAAGDLSPSSPEPPGSKGPEFRSWAAANHQTSRDRTDSQAISRGGIALNGCHLLLK